MGEIFGTILVRFLYKSSFCRNKRLHSGVKNHPNAVLIEIQKDQELNVKMKRNRIFFFSPMTDLTTVNVRKI